MNHTASRPKAAIASHSPDGTLDKSMFFPYFSASSETHTQVLISYKEGYRGQADAPGSTILGSARVVLIRFHSNKPAVPHRAADAPEAAIITDRARVSICRDKRDATQPRLGGALPSHFSHRLNRS